MIFETDDIKVMRAALTAAEHSLDFAYPQGLDVQVRLTLARAIVQAMSNGQINPGFLSYIALGKLEPKGAARMYREESRSVGRSPLGRTRLSSHRGQGHVVLWGSI
jgi:hypothetical protein